MSSSQISVNFKGQAVPRSGFSYSIIQRALDSSFWKTIANTASIVSNKIRLASGGSIASYVQCKYGIFQFLVNVPTTPSAGEAKKWGLLLPDKPAVGSAYFEIAGSVFKAVSYGDDGVAQTTVLTWAGEGVEHAYEIEWEEDYVIFKYEGAVVATHQSKVGNMPLPIYLINSDADNTDFGAITVKETALFV